MKTGPFSAIFFGIIAFWGEAVPNPLSPFQVKAKVGTSNFYGENVENLYTHIPPTKPVSAWTIARTTCGASAITELRIGWVGEEVAYVGKVNMNELCIQLP